jgi:hypothetical protein
MLAGDAISIHVVSKCILIRNPRASETCFDGTGLVITKYYLAKAFIAE